MRRASCMVAWLVTAACSASGGGTPPSSAGRADAAIAGGDAGVEDPGDASIPVTDPDAGDEPVDLAAICGGEAPVTLDDWEDCFARRRCEWLVGCQTLNRFRDVDECLRLDDAVSGGRLAMERRERARAVEQGGAQIDVEAFTRCLARTSATRCDTALYDPSCLTRFAGTVDDGGDCHTMIECRSPDASCDPTCTDDACCAGACAPKLEEGEPCTTFRSCEPGLNCNGTCKAGDVDDPCSGAGDCDPGAWCDLEAQRCRPTLPRGAECTDTLQCGGDTTCVGLSIADATPGRCLRNSRPGDPCDGAGGCHGNLYCAPSPPSALGECRELPSEGQGCSALLPCGGVEMFCKEGTCAPRGDLGMPCGDAPCRPGLFCTSALGDEDPTCAAPGAADMPCNDPGQCESYRCSGQPGVCLEWLETCPLE